VFHFETVTLRASYSESQTPDSPKHALASIPDSPKHALASLISLAPLQLRGAYHAGLEKNAMLAAIANAFLGYV